MPTETLLDERGVSLVRDGPVLTLTMARGENRMNLELADLLQLALTKSEEAPGPKALVIASKDGKFFCNGLDLAWMETASKEDIAKMMSSFCRFLGRLLVTDYHTVAAIGGHAFGAGLFLALACDWRVMRSPRVEPWFPWDIEAWDADIEAWNAERGFLNFPELNLGMRISKPFAELAKAKCSPDVLRRGFLTGKRYSSSEALAAGLIDLESPVASLPDEAQKMALGLLRAQLKCARLSPENFRIMKTELYADAYWALLAEKGGSATPESRL